MLPLVAAHAIGSPRAPDRKRKGGGSSVPRGRRRRARRLRALFLACALGSIAAGAPADRPGQGTPQEERVVQGEVPEYQAKALFLMHSAKYVRWPAEAFEDKNAPIVVTVLGVDPFGKHLDEALKGQRAGNRGYRARRARTVEELAGPTHVLFVPEGSGSLLQPALEALRGRSVLVVCESEALFQRGAMIHLLVERRRLRFDIHKKTARDAGLEISSELLKLARKVEE